MNLKTTLGKIFYILVLLALLFLISPVGKELCCLAGVRWLYIVLVSFSLSYFLVPIISYIAKKKGILDYPDQRKVHNDPTPLLGGIAVYVAFFFAIFFNFIFSTEVKGIIIAGTIILIIGILDDINRGGISAKIKLAVQLLAVFIVIKSGVSLILFRETTIWGEMGNIFLTIFWIVGLTNAMNFFDGMDGLATGLSAIIASFLGIVAFQTNQPFFGWLAGGIFGACLGFLPYNFKLKKPASIFLGDSGSTFLGFTLACLAIHGEWSDLNPIVSLTAPLLIFGVLIFDMSYITVTRLLTNKIKNFNDFIEYVGKDHLHHRLEALFRSKNKTVISIYFLSIALGLTAIVLRYARTVDAFILILQAIIILFIVTILERRGNELERRANRRE